MTSPPATTTFATLARRAEPQFIRNIIGGGRPNLAEVTPQTHTALDPLRRYLVTSVLKDVLNRGTGAGVRARGFTLPAAGKTGTSRDGWFAGFTSNLLCVDLDWLRTTIAISDLRAATLQPRSGRLHEPRDCATTYRDGRISTLLKAFSLS